MWVSPIAGNEIKELLWHFLVSADGEKQLKPNYLIIKMSKKNLVRVIFLVNYFSKKKRALMTGDIGSCQVKKEQ